MLGFSGNRVSLLTCTFLSGKSLIAICIHLLQKSVGQVFPEASTANLQRLWMSNLHSQKLLQCNVDVSGITSVCPAQVPIVFQLL